MGSQPRRKCSFLGTSSILNGSVCTGWELVFTTLETPASWTPPFSVSPTPRRSPITCSRRSTVGPVSTWVLYRSQHFLYPPGTVLKFKLIDDLRGKYKEIHFFSLQYWLFGICSKGKKVLTPSQSLKTSCCASPYCNTQTIEMQRLNIQ